MNDNVGNKAASSADRKNETLLIQWTTSVSMSGDDLQVTFKYHIKYNDTRIPEVFSRTFDLKKDEVTGLMPSSEGGVFALINTMKVIARERDKVRAVIDKAFSDRLATTERRQKALVDFGDYDPETLRLIAKYDALIWLMKKPKGWEDYKKNYRSGRLAS